jgi:enamine deaminase RidA (YjgF/YER057c/UK114 family)
MTGRIESRLAELGIVLPQLAAPTASYLRACAGGRLIFVAGHDPIGSDGVLRRGVIGAEISIAAAREHAELTGRQLLAAMHQHLGQLDRVVRVVKLFGLLRTGPGFTDHDAVLDGCSDLFVRIFGAAGRHARTAAGVFSLYGGMTMEIESVIESS